MDKSEAEGEDTVNIPNTHLLTFFRRSTLDFLAVGEISKAVTECQVGNMHNFVRITATLLWSFIHLVREGKEFHR